MNEKLGGIIIPAVTPFDERGEVDFKSMEHNYNQWNQTAVRGYMCLGSNGEFRALDDEEALAVIRAAAKYKASEKTLIAGVGRESLRHTLKFIRQVESEDLEIDYISVLTPCYFAKMMTDVALIEYYLKIADASRYPVLLYCAPGFVNGVCLSGEAVLKLADHPNIHGIKDTSANMMGAYLQALSGRDDFEILAGSLGNLWECLEGGGCGGVVSAANYLPDQCAAFMKLYQQASKEEAQHYLVSLQETATKTGGRGSVAGVKCSMNLKGYQGGFPRRPVLPLTAEVEAEIKQVFEVM